MSLFTAADHADNPPSSWRVVKVADGRWHLQTKDGATLESCTTRAKAEGLKTSGYFVTMYDKEARWYAGESIPGWRDYAELTGARA